MDFKRIELIFFCAFLSLNLFLLYTFRQSQVDQVPTSEMTTVADIESRLKADKITFEGTFSAKIYDGYYLSAETTNFHDVVKDSYDKIENHRLSRTLPLSSQITIERQWLERELKSFLIGDEPIIFGADYHLRDHPSSENSEIVLSQEFEGLPFYDETSELQFDVPDEDDKVTLKSYTQTHLSEIQPLREKQEVISENAAIKTLYMSNRIPSESKVLKTELAYTRLFTVRDKNVYIPAWFVWIETNKNNVQLERINAFTNSVISASIPEVKK
ncbi:two-component system regulatory protein YycI [uncultured Vagococcus sp.]|uniref:two-component system regulatory protein YycI n=1 Tax=uncultured Vagococcus sp. TaxID=189676 RepID=UPI0028D82A06|nr:two-component system regulatory protein YycI [uncultured Vagococcus sp.]